jgi:hypothetical protein
VRKGAPRRWRLSSRGCRQDLGFARFRAHPLASDVRHLPHPEHGGRVEYLDIVAEQRNALSA